ncbi:MAG: hypothetical protein HFG27_02090 [Provencibacterium sp.]|nr:hypothetical protein [Provencibacterium sp.]
MKHFAKVVVAGICLGLLLAAIRAFFQIDEAAFMRFYLIAGVAIVAGAALISLLYTGSYQKKMRQALVLLEEGRAQEYTEAVEKLLACARGRALQNLLRLNLSAGYCEQKQFDRALEILEGLSGERLFGIMKTVHCLNLCLCCFYTGQGEKALALYEAGKKDFARFRENSSLGGNLAVLEMLAAVEKGRYDEAEGLLEGAQKRWNNPRLQEDYRYMEALLKKQRER